MNNTQLLARASFAATILLVSASCGRPEQTAESVPKPPKTFAMNVYVSGVPFWDDSRATWNALGSGLNIHTVYGGPLDTDAQKQIQEIEELITKRVDGIVISPADSVTLVPEINKAVDSGIPVITYLNDAPTSKRLTCLTSELEEACLRIGKTALGQDNRPSKAVIMYSEPGNEEQESRRRGFETFVSRNPNIKVIGIVADKFDENVGSERLKPLLTKYPDLAYIFGCNSRSAVGAATALKELRFKPGKVTVTGWDADQDVLNLIRQGWVKESVYQNSTFMTEVAFDILDARVGGWLYPKNRRFEENGVRPVPDKIVVPVQLITTSNVGGYFPH